MNATESGPRRIARLKMPAVYLAGIVTASLVGGVAWATIPASNTGLITACVNKTTAAVRIIDAQQGAVCAGTEKAVTWPGRQLTHRGEWQAGTSYKTSDVVTSGGSSYLAKKNSKGVDPTSNGAAWGLLASRGSDGNPGADAAANTFNGTFAPAPQCFSPVSFGFFQQSGMIHLNGSIALTRTSVTDDVTYKVEIVTGASSQTLISNTWNSDTDGLQKTFPFTFDGNVQQGTSRVVSTETLSGGAGPIVGCTTTFSGSYVDWNQNLSP